MNLRSVKARQPTIVSRMIRQDPGIGNRTIDPPAAIILHGAIGDGVGSRMRVQAGSLLNDQTSDSPPAKFSGQRETDGTAAGYKDRDLFQNDSTCGG